MSYFFADDPNEWISGMVGMSYFFADDDPIEWISHESIDRVGYDHATALRIAHSLLERLREEASGAAIKLATCQEELSRVTRRTGELTAELNSLEERQKLRPALAPRCEECWLRYGAHADSCQTKHREKVRGPM